MFGSSEVPVFGSQKQGGSDDDRSFRVLRRVLGFRF